MLIPFIRTLILYFLIIFAIRLMGKRQVGEMQPSELVITILVSAVASVPMQDIDVPLSHGLIPILTLIAAEVFISSLSLFSPRFRRLFSGTPVTIIRDGKVDQKALLRLRMSMEDILEDLRLHDVFDLRDVKYAQIETNGQISLMLYEQAQPPTAADMGVKPKGSEPFFLLVSNGRILSENLPTVGRDVEWLQSIIKAAGAESFAEIYCLCADRGGQAIVLKKEG